MSNANDFVIENGVLKEYVGPGGDVVIPEGVTKIGDRVFEYRGLSSIVIPEGVTHIGSSAFNGSDFRALVLPESLEEIGPHAFTGCMVLSELVIPENVKKIGSKAFNWCLSLDKITCGNNLTKVGSNAFKDTKWFLEKIEKSVCLENVLVSVDCTDSRFIVPSNVTLIADSAFESCKGLCEIIVPETVQYIGAKAFAQCCDLTRVNVCGTPEFEKDCIPEGAMVTALSCSIDAIKFKNLKLQMALGFFLEENNDAPIPDSIVQFISKNFDKAIPHLLKTPGLLSAIAKRKLFTIEQVDILLDKSTGDAELITILLEYKNSCFSENEKAQAEKAKVKKQLSGPTAAELKKLWSVEELPNGTLSLTRYKGTETKLFVPAIIGKKSVTKIDRQCCYIYSNKRTKRQDELAEITEIFLPDGIVTIEFFAFTGCEGLKTIRIPASVTEIHKWIFHKEHLVTIIAPGGSYAEAYAKENNIPFVAE